VSSERRAAASRRNGRASQGPRTAAGKARASRNARRHGLSLPVWSDPQAAAEVRALAARIAGDGAHREQRALALRVAEAQIDLCRIRRRRHRLLDRKADAPADDGDSGPTGYLARLARVLETCGKELRALDGYERRALSRRKSAVRAFDAARRGARPAHKAGAARPPQAFWRNEPERVDQAASVLAKRTRAVDQVASVLAKRTREFDRNNVATGASKSPRVTSRPA